MLHSTLRWLETKDRLATWPNYTRHLTQPRNSDNRRRLPSRVADFLDSRESVHLSLYELVFKFLLFNKRHLGD